MFIKYINDLKEKYINKSGESITYTLWLAKWKSENSDFASYLKENEDNFYSHLGCKIINILTHSDIVFMHLIKSADKDDPYHALLVKDKNLISQNTRQSVVNMPTKLPMICPPKPYGDNLLGGYLLNDEKYSEDLFVTKKAYVYNSELSANNKIYYLVNKISSTPFKINQELLDYINTNWVKHDLLLDPYAKHKFHDLEKITKYQQSVLASYNSKIILQENILGIAEFYRGFSKIYFPLRLDQRGRLYYSPSYLNYQLNELSKVLLLFADPGIINKNNMESITYFKA